MDAMQACKDFGTPIEIDGVPFGHAFIYYMYNKSQHTNGYKYGIIALTTPNAKSLVSCQRFKHKEDATKEEIESVIDEAKKKVLIYYKTLKEDNDNYEKTKWQKK